MNHASMLGTADLCDRLGDAARVCRSPLRAYGGRPSVSGRIACLETHEDVGLLKQILARPGHGRVLVVDGGGSLGAALLGDNMARIAMSSGWAGLIVHGAVRDTAELQRLDIGIWALGTCPARGRAENLGTVDEALVFGSVRFDPGERITADADGVVVWKDG